MIVGGVTVAYCPKCGFMMRDEGEQIPVGAIGICDRCLIVVQYTGGPFAVEPDPNRLRPVELSQYARVLELASRLRMERAGLHVPIPPRGGACSAGGS